MSRVPIVNTATRAAIFERQSGGHDRGAFTLKPNETYYEPGVDLTYETLVLRKSSGHFTSHVISLPDDLKEVRYEKIEVTYDSTHDFQLVKHERTWTQKFADWNPLKSRPTGVHFQHTVVTADMNNRTSLWQIGGCRVSYVSRFSNAGSTFRSTSWGIILYRQGTTLRIVPVGPVSSAESFPECSHCHQE